MAEPGRFSVHLAKEDFKFAAAHFTLFEDGPAELLHGHNYRVAVDLEGERLDSVGLLVDIASVKRCIRSACARLDERTLVPEHSDRVQLERRAGQVELRFEGRSYVLPADDVLPLPLSNVSMELLARLLWQQIVESLRDTRVDTLRVILHETSGQSCSYRAPVG